ncbi:MAG: hypothetical protein A3G38_02425 [Omnitrophica WOR_2 bacterium RIFCSPLOWO2_12_FULL_51_8]|nr:MAG: hypothetical protein A3G38_02425 [Omnitrophica WOR_2 bacterium RIFCSPLOWO2_12_FULL_51_8]
MFEQIFLGQNFRVRAKILALFFWGAQSGKGEKFEKQDYGRINVDFLNTHKQSNAVSTTPVSCFF